MALKSRFAQGKVGSIAALLMSLIGTSALVLPGCTERNVGPSTDSQKPQSAAAKVPEASQAPAPDGKAKTAVPIPQVLQDLEKKIKPLAAPADPKAVDPNTADRKAADQERIERAGKDIEAWIGILNGTDAQKASEFLISSAQFESIASQGLRAVLGPSLVPENQKAFESILKEAQGKGVRLTEWKGAPVASSTKSSLYLKQVELMQGARLELALPERPVNLDVDLIEVDGQWKIFRLRRLGDDGAEEQPQK